MKYPVANGASPCCRRTPHLQRIEDPLLQHLGPWLPAQPRDDLAEQARRRGCCSGGAAPAAARPRPPRARPASRRADGPRRLSQTSPTGSRCRPDRCASIRRTVRSGCRVPGRCLSSGSSRSSRPVVAALHDQRRGERLGDRADPELRVRRGQRIGVAGVASCPRAPSHTGSPLRTTAPARPGRSPLDLSLGQPQVELSADRLRAGVARSPGRPGHRPAGEHVTVHVEHRLARPLAGVEDQPIAVLALVPFATSAAIATRSARACGSAAASAATLAWWARGITSTWVGACGLTSRKASTRSPSLTTCGRDLARHDAAEQAVAARSWARP